MATYFWIIIGISLFGLLAAFIFARWVLNKDTGSKEMQEISNAIKEGAEAFLKRQYKTIYLISIIFAVGLWLLYVLLGKPQAEAWYIAIGFLFGAVCSGLAGFIGMYVSIRSNIRTAAAAMKSLNDAIKISLRGGAVSGISVVAISLLGICLLFIFFGGFNELTAGKKMDIKHLERIILHIVGFGFGASFVALFAQLGGGIYTKAADVGADIVGKVESGIPEDDPRNPAVIADLVGDNVGDCAGRGADLFESTAAENIGAMILGIALFQIQPALGIGIILFPLLARAFGIIASIVGVWVVSTKEDGDPMKALNKGYLVTTIIAIIGFYAAVQMLLQEGQIAFFLCGVIGIMMSFAFVWITQYYTEYKYRPVKDIADACKTGPATTIIQGFAVALECTAMPVIVISAAIVGSYYLGQAAIPDGGLFGTAVATMGMLSTAGYILAMDTFGPITDNAGGIVEMSKQPAEIREKTDRLDAVGNTTKALTKGYAIGSAALAAFLLFRAYLDEVVILFKHEHGENLLQSLGLTSVDQLYKVDIGKPEVFIGALIGATLVFLFSALAIKAVGKAAKSIIEEVRRQFKEDPGIMKGTSKPDYGRCVDIVTISALKKMVVPGLLVVAVPVLTGIVFNWIGDLSGKPTLGVESVAAVLMVGTIGGILLATLMNNGGGAWDNAKKYVEMGIHGGKGSEAHEASIVGDTVGDPFKDTAGPSIHVLIKLLATVTLVLAPLFI